MFAGINLLPMTPPPPTPSQSVVLTLPITHAHFIWYCAWFSLPSAIYAYSNPASAHFAIVPASVFATSLLYWRNPVRNSWRRRIDIAVVLSGVIYQTYYAFLYVNHSYTTQIYTALIGVSTACFGLSNYLMTRGSMWSATYAHAAIHIIANVANLVLYDGYNNYNNNYNNNNCGTPAYSQMVKDCCAIVSAGVKSYEW